MVIDWFVLVMYAIAAVSAGMGGCAYACWYMTHHKQPKVAFALAYTVLSMIFGVVTFAVLSMYHPVESVHQLIFYSMTGGLTSAITLGAANISVRLVLRRLGVEVQFTMRRSGENRRAGDKQ